MCLIIVGLRKDIKDNWLPLAWASNKDGAGYAIAGKVPYISKGFMTLEALQKAFKDIPQNAYMALHFRMGTHGNVSAKNTHPFKIDDNNWLMHNGILNGLGSFGPRGYSDSMHLAKILSQIRPFDRKALLTHLNGRFAIISNKIHLYGDFKRYNNCYHSNSLLIPVTSTVLGYRNINDYKMTTGFGNRQAYSYDDDECINMEANIPRGKSWLERYNDMDDGLSDYKWNDDLNDFVKVAKAEKEEV